jgi:hypothetical protein
LIGQLQHQRDDIEADDALIGLALELNLSEF